MRLAPVSPRPVARTCSDWAPLKGASVVSMEVRACVPWNAQPVAPDSKPGLVIRFTPPLLRASTSSTRHSPAPCRKNSNRLGVPLPLVPLPMPSVARSVRSMSVQGAFADSSLSAQLAANRLLPRGSVSSRLLPPPSDHWPQRPPSP